MLTNPDRISFTAREDDIQGELSVARIKGLIHISSRCDPSGDISVMLGFGCERSDRAEQSDKLKTLEKQPDSDVVLADMDKSGTAKSSHRFFHVPNLLSAILPPVSPH